MSKRSQRRRELLDRQANALAPFLKGTTDRHILCPLCLNLLPEASWPDLSIEDAPPKQYDGEERCMTCSSGNNRAGGTYETRVRIRNDDRTARVARANPFVRTPSGLTVARQPLYTPMAVARQLARPSTDEFRLELKSAYLIAFAALGHRYILGPGLDQVRELIDPDEPDDSFAGIRPCARVDGVPVDSKLLVVHDPLPCLIVPHPTRHRRDDQHHYVLLPLPGSDRGFYRSLALLEGRLRVGQADVYGWPPARRLPMVWDQNGHAFQSRTRWTSADGTGTSTEPSITIDLS